MFYETASNAHGLPHDPFKALVTPRPIGWITAMSAKGEINLSPYSFFNAVSERPPMVAFSSSGRKDAVTFVWTRAVHLGDPQLDRALQLIVCTAAILLVSHLTFRWIEIPARQYLNQRLLKRRERPIELSPPAP